MSWNYRLCRYTLNGKPLFGLREVYYESDGNARGFTAASVIDWGSRRMVKAELERMLRALDLPVLTIPWLGSDHGVRAARRRAPARGKSIRKPRKKAVKQRRK